MVKKIDNKSKPLTESESELKEARVEVKQRLADEESGNTIKGEKKIKVETEADGPKIDFNKKSWMNKSRDFGSLYRGSGGKRIDMSKIDRKDPNRKKKIVGWTIFILVILLGITLAGFYFFINQEDKFSGNKIDIEIEKPLSVASGDMISFSIIVHNNESVDLVNTELTIQFPSDFVFNSSEPMTINEANNAWSIGEIKKGRSETVKIVGQLLGELNSTEDFAAILSYMPANFLSEFQKRKSFSLEINDSIFDLDLEVPTKVVSGYEGTYKIVYTNNSKEDIKRVRLTLFLPEDLEVGDFSPSLDNEETVWELDTLGSRASQEISFQGVLTAEEGAMREIKAQIGYINQQGEYLVQVEETSIIFIINPQLLLTLAINDSTQDNVASFGETLNYVLKYQNESQSEIKDMSVVLKLQGEALDWDSIVDVNDGEIIDNKISWDQSKITDLSSVEPGEQGEIKFSINLHNNILAEDRDDINYYITGQATARSEEVVDLEGSLLEIESEKITTKINSHLVLRAEGRYHNDEYIAVGSGPVPPEVGQTTQYQIYWYLQNGANEVSSVEVTAEIPKDVLWVNDTYVSAGNFSYDPTAHTVTWSINKMPEHTGQFTAELEARFAVEVTPTSDDVAKLLILSEKSQVIAYDTFTEQEISMTQDMITSDLTTDPLVVGKGLVVPESSSTNSNSNTNININTNTNSNINSL